jgi:transposase-like protein
MSIKQGMPGRQRRRHSAEFKAKLIEECRRPGVSMASVAMANGVNPNLLRNWVVHEGKSGSSAPAIVAAPKEEFIALPLIAGPTPAADIRIELRRGATTITIVWPAQAGKECAAWLREWLG